MLCKYCNTPLKKGEVKCPKCKYNVDSEGGIGFEDYPKPPKPDFGQKLDEFFKGITALEKRTYLLLRNSVLVLFVLTIIIGSISLFFSISSYRAVKEMSQLNEESISTEIVTPEPEEVDVIREKEPTEEVRIDKEPESETLKTGSSGDVIFDVRASGDVSAFRWERLSNNNSWESIDFENNVLEEYNLQLNEDMVNQLYRSQIISNGLKQNCEGTYRCVVIGDDGSEKATKSVELKIRKR